MDNSIKERLFVAVASHCANEGRAWTLVDIVLAELAGEIRDAERYRAYRQLVKDDSLKAQAMIWNARPSRKRFDKAIDEARHG